MVIPPIYIVRKERYEMYKSFQEYIDAFEKLGFFVAVIENHAKVTRKEDNFQLDIYHITEESIPYYFVGTNKMIVDLEGNTVINEKKSITYQQAVIGIIKIYEKFIEISLLGKKFLIEPLRPFLPSTQPDKSLDSL